MMYQWIEIGPNGQPEREVVMTDLVQMVCDANLRLYHEQGFLRPWIAYLALQEDVVLGTCAFKSPPNAGKVEIAYFTFPEHEGKGIATWMAEQLIAIAHREDRHLVVTAQTLPEKNASTAILEKLGFTRTGEAWDEEVGTVWAWQRSSDLA